MIDDTVVNNHELPSFPIVDTSICFHEDLKFTDEALRDLTPIPISNSLSISVSLINPTSVSGDHLIIECLSSI